MTTTAGASQPTPRRETGLGRSTRLFTVGGVDVAVHASWLVIFGLVTWSLATGFFPQVLPGANAAEEWLLGVIAALLLFASVLAHELAHSFVARASGIDVRSITLFIFGGVSNLSGEAKEPGTEFRIAIVGPLTSFAIAIVAFAVATVVAVPQVAATAGYLAFINAALGIFNLIPGFPLDGGRVLRSIVWSATNDLRRATEIASGVGQVVAWGLMLLGLWRVLQGDLFGGIWMAAIGWFLQNAAAVSLEQTVVDTRLRRLRVRDAVRPDDEGVDPSATVAELIEEHMLPGARRAVPVVEDGRLLGLVTLSDVRSVPVEQRPSVRVADVMVAEPALSTVTPATPLRQAIETLAEGDWEQVPVVDGGRLVGVLTRADIMRQLQVREALGLGS